MEDFIHIRTEFINEYYKVSFYKKYIPQGMDYGWVPFFRYSLDGEWRKGEFTWGYKCLTQAIENIREKINKDHTIPLKHLAS